MNRILVTGCSGVLGENLVAHLAKKNDVEIVGLDLYAPSDRIKDDMTFFSCDITDENKVKEVMAGIDCVVHAASASPAYSESKIFEIVVNGTENLLNAAKQTGVERFVYVSSTAVYGFPDRVPMKEDDPIQPYHDPYNRAKAAAEKRCLAYREEGLCIPILRPRTFLGPNRLGTFAMLFEWAREGKNFPILGNGKNRYQFLDVEDLCEAIWLTLSVESTKVNDTFNIGAKEYGSMKAAYQAVLDEAGFGKKIRCVPATPAMLILDVLSKLKLTPLYKRLYRKVHMDYFASIEKAEDKLGFKPKFSNSETLVRSYLWYCEHQAAIENVSGERNNAQWNQGVLKLAKVFF